MIALRKITALALAAALCGLAGCDAPGGPSGPSGDPGTVSVHMSGQTGTYIGVGMR